MRYPTLLCWIEVKIVIYFSVCSLENGLFIWLRFSLSLLTFQEMSGSSVFPPRIYEYKSTSYIDFTSSFCSGPKFVPLPFGIGQHRVTQMKIGSFTKYWVLLCQFFIKIVFPFVIPTQVVFGPERNFNLGGLVSLVCLISGFIVSRVNWRHELAQLW